MITGSYCHLNSIMEVGTQSQRNQTYQLRGTSNFPYVEKVICQLNRSSQDEESILIKNTLKIKIKNHSVAKKKIS